VLSIIVWDHPELTIPAGEVRAPESAGRLVNQRGEIFFPYVGVVKVAGKTVDQVRELLAARIARYIAKPQLDVRVAAFRSKKVFVVGEVQNPGAKSIDDVPMTLMEAISRAGYALPEADLTNVTLTRGDKLYRLDLLALYQRADLARRLRLVDGDVINIPDRRDKKVFVLGEVTKPTTLTIDKGRLTLAEALGEAGGVNPVTSDPRRIYVIRGTQQAPEIYQLDAKSPSALLLAEQFELQPRDVVYVSAAGITRWDRVVRQLLPMLQGVNQAAAVAR